MSIPDSNSSASVTATPSLSNASGTPAAPVNTAIPRPSQPPLAPPPPPPPTYRHIAPLRHPNPLQQAHNNLYAQSIPIRRPNQDPSAVLYPLGPPGRGFSSRPVRGFVADQNGYPPRPGLAYSYRQFGPSQMESMMQFMRGRTPPIAQLPRLGSGSPVGSGPRRGSPQFLQPRVAPSRTSVLDTSRNRKARSKDEALVLVRGRKVKITEGASLYSLGRSWLTNGTHVGIKPQMSGTMGPLPNPVPVDMTETSVPDDPAEESDDPAEESADEDEEDEEAVKELSEKDLLKRHIERAKKVRARLREERRRKIKRFRGRLSLILAEDNKEYCVENN